MNLGQQIHIKSETDQSVNDEIKKFEQIINQISQNEKHLPDINLNLFLTTDFREHIKNYIILTDELFNNIQCKYFKPNGLELKIYISVVNLYMYGEVWVDSTEISTADTQLKLDFIEDENKDEDREYDWNDTLFNIWDSELFNKLLTTLNISYLAVIIGAILYNDEIEFQIIEVNYERD